MSSGDDWVFESLWARVCVQSLALTVNKLEWALVVDELLVRAFYGNHLYICDETLKGVYHSYVTKVAESEIRHGSNVLLSLLHIFAQAELWKK